MQTPDGSWRVEAIRKGRHYYRVLHDGQVHAAMLLITAVERVLREEAGVDIASLVPAP